MNRVGCAEDVRLWQCLLQGDQDALAGLFRKYYRPLMNYGLKLADDKSLVKDSLQELFYDIWNQRAGLSEVEHVRSYFYTALRRAVLRQIEIQQTRRWRDRAYSAEFAPIAEPPKPSGDGEIASSWHQRRLRQSLEQLSDRQKEAIFLKFYSGLSNAEIAQVMGVNTQSVYNYIYRALQSLRTIMTG